MCMRFGILLYIQLAKKTRAAGKRSGEYGIRLITELIRSQKIVTQLNQCEIGHYSEEAYNFGLVVQTILTPGNALMWKCSNFQVELEILSLVLRLFGNQNY